MQNNLSHATETIRYQGTCKNYGSAMQHICVNALNVSSSRGGDLWLMRIASSLLGLDCVDLGI